MSHLIATFFYVGHMRPAPGTWGSLAGLILAVPIGLVGGPLLLGLLILVALVGGVSATRRYTAGAKNHDPSEVVIDEVVGIWIALVPVVAGATAMNAPLLDLWPGWISAFVLFRIFDITKPSLIGWADRRHDAWGVMLDDVFAGIAAALGTVILAGLAHGVLM